MMTTKTRTAPDARPMLIALFAVVAALAVTTARGATPGGDALAVSRFDRIGTAPVDSLTVATDHCVAQIAAGMATARNTCRGAVQHAHSLMQAPATYATSSGRRDLAFALGNLAVAEAQQGDMERARATTLRALAYAPQQPLLTANLRILEARRLYAPRTEMTAN
jgi:hypothetical protein